MVTLQALGTGHLSVVRAFPVHCIGYLEHICSPLSRAQEHLPLLVPIKHACRDSRTFSGANPFMVRSTVSHLCTSVFHSLNTDTAFHSLPQPDLVHCCLPFSCVRTKLLQSCPALCDPVDCSLTGSSVHGTLQARTQDWVAMPPPGDLPDQTQLSGVSEASYIGRRVLYL